VSGRRARAVFLDAGGTVVLPERGLVADALSRVGIAIDPSSVPAAHYAAVRALDRDQVPGGRDPYIEALCVALGASADSAVAALSTLGDRNRSGKVLWSEPTPSAVETITALRRAGVAVVIVTNSDGHAAENLRDAGLLEATGLTEADVVDSVVVGSTKPDRVIFEAALERAGVTADDVVHVGDMLSTDVAGAMALGITAVHLNPYRRCRRPEHRHVRSLAGIWAHLGRG
jgi:HAD superfamily hydrolase (TIGR01509 family)